jgi:di/tricarboxylate transporter
MTRTTRSTTALVIAIACLVIALVIFALADGLRRWYSGGFFLFMGLVMLTHAMRWRKPPSNARGAAP